HRGGHHEERHPTRNEAQLGRAIHLVRAGLERAGDDHEDHAEDREAIPPRERRAEHAPGLGTRRQRAEERRRDDAAEDETAGDDHRESEVIEELKDVGVEGLHVVRTYQPVAHRGISERRARFRLAHQGSVSVPTYRDYFADIKKHVKEATPQQVADLLRRDDVQLADVRESDEWSAGHLPGAVHVPKSFLEQWAEDRIPDKTKKTVLYCAGGVRSAMAADTLQKLGYTDVISMSGGFNRWKDSGMAWVTPESFSGEQAQRYS